MPGILEFFSLQNETKMNKIGDYDPFSDFFMFHSKRWLGMKKKYLKSEILASLPWENFLNIRKNRNSLAIMSLEEIMQMANKITFFFTSLWKKQTINPKLRSLRLGKI
jgi:hypothetical protein